MAAVRRTIRDIRSESRLVVMRALLDAGESTRGDLARVTGLSVGTVSTIVADLLKCGLVAETGLISQPVGRPTVGLRLNAERGRVVGVYVEETDLEVVVFDAAFGELATAAAVAPEHDADRIFDAIEGAIDTALQRAQANRDDVLGVGVLLPGGLQRPVKASPVPDAIWRHLDRLRDRLGLPVVVDNPLKAIATSQLWFGPGRRYANLVAVNLGVGVGAGIVQDGTVMRGATDTAGEWGHTLFAFDGRQCQCGRRGCVEAYVGAAGIRRTLADIAPDHPLTAVDGHREFVAALAAALTAADDPAVSATVDRTANYLGAALTDLVAIVNPEVITLTGWTACDLGAHMLPTIRGRVRADAPGDAAADLAIEVASGRGLAGIAVIALERFLRDVGLVTTRVLPAL